VILIENMIISNSAGIKKFRKINEQGNNAKTARIYS
jgi:hypothetical protein